MRKFSPIIILLVIAHHVAGQTPLKPRDTTIKGPQTFAIILGISKYKYVRPLSFADKDAELFRDYLKSPGGGSVQNDNIFCLLNENALCSNFWGKGFQWLRAKSLQKGDRLFIYLAGHGDVIDEDQFFFLGYDCNPGGDKNNYLAGGAIQLFNLKKKIAAETAKGVEVFFIMDACRSSELPGGLPGLNFLNTAISEKKAGEMIMLATGAGQESLEDASIGTGHGLFTYYLVDGLTGSADSIGVIDRKISFQEIQYYVSRNVPSVAQERFKRKQDPYFCCNENSEKIVGIVDTAYLSNWLKAKRLQRRGPGNSYPGNVSIDPTLLPKADTTLIEAYNLFYKAVRENKFTGQSSAEYYYQQMDKNFPRDPYTLDAKSTLAVEFINYAQRKVNQYLDCGDEMSIVHKQESLEAGNRLEKAIAIMREDEPDFAHSLLGRMYFLKASGSQENISIAFQNAFAAFALDPGAAYINNRLATLHLDNNRADSAVFYARRAMEAAPKWRCAYTTLANAFTAMNLPDSVSKYRQKSIAPDPTQPVIIKKVASRNDKRKIQFGIVAGAGINKLKITRSDWRQGTINYGDSLNNITAGNGGKFDVGFIYQLNLSNTVALRPSLYLSFENADLIYDRKTQPGERILETINIKTSSFVLSMPLVFKFSERNIAPFISAGPAFSYLMKQNAESSSKIPIKSFGMSGEAGIGVDIGLTGVYITPEIKFSTALSSIREDANNIYTNTISSLKRQTFTFSVYLRRN